MTKKRGSRGVDVDAAYGAALAQLLAAPTLPKLGLARMRALLAQLGDPQLRYPVLHIAGTKGKGSTAALTASIVRAAGKRVGLTTSPHLLSARERIVVDDALIDAAAFVDVAARVDAAARALPAALDAPSFFERMCAMAFLHFADVAVDVAVVEVGLGGRLDATNVVSPAACAITRLGMDHMEYLGPTLAHIAREKAGIIKAGVPVVTVAQDAVAAAVVAAVAAGVAAPVTVVDAAAVAALDDVDIALAGAHQRENAATAVALVDAAAPALGFTLTRAHVRAGCARVRWPGRFERVAPRVILDGAHNVDSAHALAAAIAALAEEKPLPRPLSPERRGEAEALSSHAAHSAPFSTRHGGEVSSSPSSSAKPLSGPLSPERREASSSHVAHCVPLSTGGEGDQGGEVSSSFPRPSLSPERSDEAEASSSHVAHHVPRSTRGEGDRGGEVSSAVQFSAEGSATPTPVHLVLGMSRGHDPGTFVDVLAPLCTSIVATAAVHPRAIPAAEVARAACVVAVSGVVDVVVGVRDAVAVAVARAERDDGVVVVCGSLFVVGEARAAFVDMPTDPVRPAY